MINNHLPLQPTRPQKQKQGGKDFLCARNVKQQGVIQLKVLDCTSLLVSVCFSAIHMPSQGASDLSISLLCFREAPSSSLSSRVWHDFSVVFRANGSLANLLSFYSTEEKVAPDCLLSIVSGSYPLHTERPGLLKRHCQKRWMKYSSALPRRGLSWSAVLLFYQQ